MDEASGPSPLDQALAHLTKLIAAGTSPDRITREVGTLVASWADEPDMDAGTAQNRILLVHISAECCFYYRKSVFSLQNFM